jgi:signal recognition particle receptor subunit beta
MAIISVAKDALVIRVVYDGPPMAGKSTSVRSLAGKLGGNVTAPEEIDGRTLYFDWLDYTGGLFEGRRIRCQIISVPGQATLASRRRRLLESADVVVFVSDSTADAVDQTSNYVSGLRRVLETLPGPPIGIVVQANKRDCPDAVSLSEFNTRLEATGSRAAVIESVATAGVGIREAFVFAVRLALDRVRELMRTQQLSTGDPTIDSPEALLEDMRSNEGEALSLAVSSGLKHTKLSEVRTVSLAENSLSDALQAESTPISMTAESQSVWSQQTYVPHLPNAELPGGMIWPPVEGRVTLHELAGFTLELRQEETGDWCADIEGKWRIQSPAAAAFGDLQTGREAILNWARMHSACQKLFVGARCIVLAPDGQGGFRLWQIVTTSRTLCNQIEFALSIGFGSMISSLLDATHHMLRAHREWTGDAAALPITLTTVSETYGPPRFVGLMSFPIINNAKADVDWPSLLTADLDAVLVDIRRLRDEFLSDEPNQSLIPRNLRSDPASDIVERFLRSI